MKKTIFALLLAALLGCDTSVKKEETAGLDYGPKPSRWREEIKSYLDLRLTNPKESVVEFRSEPKQLFQRDTLVRERQYGWATCVWVNEMKDGKPRALPDDLLHPGRQDRGGEQRSRRPRPRIRALRARAVLTTRG